MLTKIYPPPFPTGSTNACGRAYLVGLQCLVEEAKVGQAAGVVAIVLDCVSAAQYDVSQQVNRVPAVQSDPRVAAIDPASNSADFIVDL